MKNYVKKLIRKARDKYSKHKSVELTLPEENNVYFCFAGEFGYELISWIPFLLFLKNNTRVKINTVSRRGSKIFYYFSDNHLELESDDITFAWGDVKNYKKVQKRLGIKKMIYPANQYTEKRILKVNGYEWINKDIHSEIEEKNYSLPNFSQVVYPLPFNLEKYAVINNKYVKEWGKKPINFFNRQELIDLRDLLLSRGVGIVYNRFIEETAVDEALALDDADIFTQQGCFDMRNFYTTEKSPGHRNQIQLSMFNQAEFVIGVQGGNVYLPAVCRKQIFMLMKKGNYLDYRELSRIFKTELEVFYEPKHIVDRLKIALNKQYE